MVPDDLVAAPGRDTSAGNPPPPEETSPGGAFETFLNEDPARRKLPKSEQFAAFEQELRRQRPVGPQR